MNRPQLEMLVLTEDEYQVAHEEIRKSAYHKWLDAECCDDRELEFWLEAEQEWIETCYVPDRYATAGELREAE